MSGLTVVKALNRALHEAMAADPGVLVLGEDVGVLGGVFRVTEGLSEAFGEQRVIDTPLAESGIIGTAIGLALRGFRPVAEIQFDGFVFPGFDQVVNQLARYRSRTHGRQGLPVVIRIPFGGGIGAAEHHSESPEAYFMHTPGLHVLSCACPQDAHWLLRQAIACPDRVILFEPKARYYAKGEVDESGPDLPMGSARIVRPGRDAALLTYGPMVRTCLDAAAVAAEEGTSVEVVDLRSLAPIDWVSLAASVRRTRRAIVVHEAPRTLGLGAEIAARLHEDLFYDMESPVLRVTGYDIPYPPSRLEDEFLPSADRILDALDRSLAW